MILVVIGEILLKPSYSNNYRIMNRIETGYQMDRRGEFLHKMASNVSQKWKDRIKHFPFLVAFYNHVAKFDILDYQRGLTQMYGKAIDIQFKSPNFVMSLDLTELQDVLLFLEIVNRGYYEFSVSHYLINSLNNFDVFIDVGANSGYYSLMAASILGTDKSVISLEPNKKAFTRLARNVELNSFENRIRALNVGASDETKQGTLYLSAEEDGLSSLVKITPKTSKIDLIRLDSIFVDIPERFVCKIDVEGYELNVLKGMTKLLKNGNVFNLIVEWNSNYAGDELWLELVKIGEIFRIEDRRGTYELVPVFNKHQLDNKYTNLLIA